MNHPVVTIFRSRLAGEAEPEYGEWAARMAQLAAGMPGLHDFKTFTAEDGERVTIVEFASLEHLDAWKNHPEHRKAQRLGRKKFYETFSVQTARVLRARSFKRRVDNEIAET